MSTHTPGPWLANVRKNDHNGWRDPALYVSINADAALIAAYPVEYEEYPKSDEECEANARLMAAAPELLVELKSALATLEAVERVFGKGAVDHNQMACHRAVIAKAEAAS